MSGDYFSLGYEDQRRELFPEQQDLDRDQEASVRLVHDPADQIQSRAGSSGWKRSESHLDSSSLLQQNYELKKKLIRMEVESKRERALMLQQFEELKAKMIHVEEKEKFVQNTQAGLNELIQNFAPEKVNSSRFKIAEKSDFELSSSKNQPSIDYEELQSSARHRYPVMRDAKSFVMSGKLESHNDSQNELGFSDKQKHRVPSNISNNRQERSLNIELNVQESQDQRRGSLHDHQKQHFKAEPPFEGADLQQQTRKKSTQANTGFPDNQTSQTFIEPTEQSQIHQGKDLSSTLKLPTYRGKKAHLHLFDTESSANQQITQQTDNSMTSATMIKESLECEAWKFKHSGNKLQKIPMQPSHLKLSLGASTDFDVIRRNAGAPESPDTFRAKQSDYSSFKKLAANYSPKQPSGMSTALTPLNLSKVLSLGGHGDHMSETPNVNSLLKQGLGIPNHISDKKHRSSILKNSRDQNTSNTSRSKGDASILNTSKQRVFYHGKDALNSSVLSSNRMANNKKHQERVLDEYDQSERDQPVKETPKHKGGEYNLIPAGSFLFKKLSSRTPRSQVQTSDGGAPSGVLMNISKINIDFNTGKIGIKMQPGELLRNHSQLQENTKVRKVSDMNSSRIMGSRDVTLDFEPKPATGRTVQTKPLRDNSQFNDSRVLRQGASTDRTSRDVQEQRKVTKLYEGARIISVPVKFGDDKQSECSGQGSSRFSQLKLDSSPRGISSGKFKCLVSETQSVKGYLSTSRNRRQSIEQDSGRAQEVGLRRKPLANLLIQPPVSKRKQSPISGNQSSRAMLETATFAENHSKRR